MDRIRANFNKQVFMRTLGAELVSWEAGRARISCGIGEPHLQQHGYAHAGVLTSIADSACGYAALSTMPDVAEVMSVEFKISFLRPCTAERIVAEGWVLKTGKTLVFTEGAVTDAEGFETFAKMTATMICLMPRS